MQQGLLRGFGEALLGISIVALVPDRSCSTFEVTLGLSHAWQLFIQLAKAPVMLMVVQEGCELLLPFALQRHFFLSLLPLGFNL